MTKHYVDLRLYLGGINNHGCSEGDFHPEFGSEREKERCMKAMKAIRQSLDLDLEIKIAEDNLIKTEKDAKGIIYYSEKNIPSSGEIIELDHCMHGRITFWRKIRCEGYTKRKRRGLIDQFMKSGYEPDNWQINKLRYDIKNWREGSYRDELRSLLKKGIRKAWSDNLEFH